MEYLSVSSMLVAPRSGSNDQSRHMQINKAARNKESYAVAEAQNKHGNSFASREYAHLNKSIIYITSHKQKAPINMLSRR